MWYVYFFNPPATEEMFNSGEFYETDRSAIMLSDGKESETPGEDYSFVYTIAEENKGKISGLWLKSDNDGHLIHGVVPDGMNIRPFLRSLFKRWETVSTDGSVFEDASRYFKGMTEEENDIMWGFLFLSQMLARNIVTMENSWSKRILSTALKYMVILDKYDLFFTEVNFFAPSKRAVEKLTGKNLTE